MTDKDIAEHTTSIKGIARTIAYKRKCLQVLEDLEQEGFLALCRLHDEFDRQGRSELYLYRSIKNSVIDALYAGRYLGDYAGKFKHVSYEHIMLETAHSFGGYARYVRWKSTFCALVQCYKQASL